MWNRNPIPPITDEQFKADADEAALAAKEFAIGQKALAPHLFVHYYNADRLTNPSEPISHDCVAIHADFNDWDEKSRLLRKLGGDYLAARRIPVSVYFISEAWMSTRDKSSVRLDEDGQPIADCMPRDDPDRTEVITMAGMATPWKERPIQLICGCVPIIRDDAGLIQIAAEWELHHEGMAPILEQFFVGYHEAARKHIRIHRRN